ncbi:hypothetical protein C9374_001311 [Naegleria lovaniensis]|uniref:GATA-type domain-containing protein n=1 Tax=Naegleria lovaniensis TaxID=51637 RepID=A0AA88KS33_NAELO|nr:uncharacterized protein C9374_001311 [Naegleria lovaniensis]KAG2387717.1 hypothetical protein C9374_001311 [Naegleria lovaniensis]
MMMNNSLLQPSLQTSCSPPPPPPMKMLMNDPFASYTGSYTFPSMVANMQCNASHSPTCAQQTSNRTHAATLGNVKQCANYKCGTTKTPLWRKGWTVEEPSSKNGYKPKTVFLCNKCGLHYRKGHYCKECLEIFKESDMRNEKQFWLICSHCNQWIHKKCMKETCQDESNYVCCECKENPSRTLTTKRKKKSTVSKQVASASEEEEEVEEIAIPKRRVQHKRSYESSQEETEFKPSQPATPLRREGSVSPTSPNSMPFKKRIKGSLSPSTSPEPMMQPLKISRIYSKIASEIDGYTTETSSPTTSENEEDYSLSFSPIRMPSDGPRVFLINQPMTNSSSAIDMLASICEQMQ